MMMQSWCCACATGKTGMAYKSKKPAGRIRRASILFAGRSPLDNDDLSSIPRFALVNSSQRRFYDGSPNFKESARIR